MSTKLEAMVGLLAGRKVDAGLLDELDDPSSEASRFLEATRARSKALFAEPVWSESTRTSKGRWVALIAVLTVTLMGLAAMSWLVDRRFRLLEASLTIRDVEARAEARRLEAILERLSGPKPAPEPLAPLKDALERIEADLVRLEQLAARKPEPSNSDPGVAQVREDLALIRRELSTTERMEAQRVEELRASVHDAARVLRLLLNRLDPTSPVPEPSNGFSPARPTVPVETRRLKP